MKKDNRIWIRLNDDETRGLNFIGQETGLDNPSVVRMLIHIYAQRLKGLKNGEEIAHDGFSRLLADINAGRSSERSKEEETESVLHINERVKNFA